MAESEMVERVARALCVAHGSDPDTKIPGKTHVVDMGGLPTLLPDHNGPLWQIYTADARAALEAMREPTPEMGDKFMRGMDFVQWSKDQLEAGEWYGNFKDFSSSWSGAISAALGQEGTEG